MPKDKNNSRLKQILMGNLIFVILKVIGSLALLMYGMKTMSEGVQKFAGSQLRNILGTMTKNRFTGLLTGVFVTASIQSSTATTVMTVSFVNAGLLTLAQAISVIMGANIGTTVTAWIMAIFGFQINMSDFVFPLFAFAIPLIFSSKSSRKSLGEFIFGFAFMESLNLWIDSVNNVLWTYLLIGILLGCALWFTIRTKGVQFRMIGEMFRLLGESTSRSHPEEKHISSFQAFAVSIATRVGTGNLAGVASALTVGGPGAVFWMWIIALLGSASAFIESTLAQLYKIRGKDSFIGGPAYYIQRGLGLRWMAILFAVLITLTFGLAFNSVQSNTICAACSDRQEDC